ncbi:MAG: hypothetical protein H7301_06615 [Cryobacterium sp.]|nr:hypothetical protein [Oligoflexia bacterium]
MKKILLASFKGLFSAVLFILLGVVLYSLVTFSAMLAPALVALFTVSIAGFPIYLTKAPMGWNCWRAESGK